MKMSTKQLLSAVALASLALGAPLAVAAGKKSNVKIVNKSDWRIQEFYLAPHDNEEWGPDQLAKHVIAPGETFTLNQVPCGTWDVKLVDEDEDECIVESVDLCGQSDIWTITSKDLLACQAGS